ncbi:MAG: ribosome biogenesis GTP-binding protein YsxC, partial [Oscillospiraceae bacterium]|nr:ribosome biogenesis GTP-binding protein YsxC [Oscillospiraceae bacterium]
MNFNKAKFEISYGISSQLPKSERLEFAFVGRSNVGKSSLINKIFNRKNLARVSAVPGKTATINFYSVEQTLFVDLPGYGFAKVAKSEKHRWSELIEGYFNQDRNVGLVFSLIDMRHPPTKLDIDMLQYLL